MENNMKVQLETCLEFAEWMDLNCVRNNQHEWMYRGDNFTNKFSTEKLFNVFCHKELSREEKVEAIGEYHGIHHSAFKQAAMELQYPDKHDVIDFEYKKIKMK